MLVGASAIRARRSVSTRTASLCAELVERLPYLRCGAGPFGNSCPVSIIKAGVIALSPNIPASFLALSRVRLPSPGQRGLDWVALKKENRWRRGWGNELLQESPKQIVDLSPRATSSINRTGASTPRFFLCPLILSFRESDLAEAQFPRTETSGNLGAENGCSRKLAE